MVVTTLGMCLTTVAGSLLMTVGMVSSAFVSNPYLLYVTYGLTAGTGLIRAATSENVLLDMCAQRRFRSACAFAQSDQNLHWAHFG